MKTSLVIASVLLTGLALEVAAYRINNNEYQAENNQWTSQQGNSYLGGVSNYEKSNQNTQYSQNVPYNKQYNEYDSSFTGRSQQNSQTYESAFESSQEITEGQKLYHQNHNQAWSIDQSAGITRKIVEKIAEFQKIAQRANEHFDNTLTLNKNVIKMSEHNFVTFFNTTMKHLNDGQLEYVYMNPVRDTILAQYQFNQVKTVGSFKSNVHGANAGYFDIVLNKVNSNVSTGFNNDQLIAIRPAQFQYAEATMKTEDGVETQEFNDALKHRYLRVLENAMSTEVSRSINRGMIAQMKNEIRKPVVFYSNAAEKKGKLFDMRWTEDDVSMEMPNIGFQNPEIISEPFQCSAVSFYRKSENLYRMRYHFVLNNLEWTSPLTVESAGKRINIRSANFKINEINIHATVNKLYGQQQQQQQSCDQINTNVEVTGFRYNFNENVPSETMTKIENKLQRFIQHSLEYYVQESLKQELCQSHNY